MNRSTRPDVSKETSWSFIGGARHDDKPFEETICGEVEKETSIKLTKVELLSSEFYVDRKRYFFQAKLTDDNVNNIKRADGQILAFFTFKELAKLSLTPATQLFLIKHHDVLEKAPSN